MNRLQSLRISASQPPTVIGVSNHNDGTYSPYLIRWTLLSFFGWTLRFHVFLRSDPDHPHDHPWKFWSLVLAGQYSEESHSPSGTTSLSTRKAGSLAFRPATHRHRVILPTDSHGNPYPCLTLILTAPKERNWGFWCPNQRFIPWEPFVHHKDRC